MLAENTLLVRYAVTGGNAVYAVPFRVYRPEDVAVTWSADGRTESALALGKDYSVRVLATGGAELRLEAGVVGGVVPAGATLAIASAIPETQEADFSNTATVNTGALELQLDREVQMIQQLHEELSRAVKVPAAGEESPEDLLKDIFATQDNAAQSAAEAAASAEAAKESEVAAAGSAALAAEQREAACACAREAQAARDVAIIQTETANELMETELAKVNAIVAANRTDQQAAVDKARQWAEKEPNLPVDFDADGNPEYSARHWALKNIWAVALDEPFPVDDPEAQAALAKRLPVGALVSAPVDEEEDESGPGDVYITNNYVQPYNTQEWITESGEWVAPVDGDYDIWIIGGGGGGYCPITAANRVGDARGGASGKQLSATKRLSAGTVVSVTIGAGGQASTITANYGGDTVFGELSTIDGARFAGSYLDMAVAHNLRAEGGGLGGALPHYANQGSNDGAFYGAGGAAAYLASSGAVNIGNGAQGAIRLRYHDPAKADCPTDTPASARARKSARAAKPATVNLYDPETGQGSVWREEDAPAKLAEGLISEEAWREICAQRAAEAHAAWLADPETSAERFALLRRARDARLAATDYLVAPDYQLTEEQRAAVTAYRQALRDLPAKEGAPWDGGGELTPWPVKPELNQEQQEG